MKGKIFVFCFIFLISAFVVSAYTCSDVDLNKDNIVNAPDLLNIRQCLNQTSSNCSTADIDKNGIVDESDANILRQFYLQTCDASQTCTDSDGGLNYYVSGDAMGSNGQGTFDGCDFGSSEKGILWEAICENGTATFYKTACPSETPYCNRGICSTQKPICSDSDNGNNPQIKGTVIEPRIKDGPEYTDYCENLQTYQPWEDCKGDSCGLREYYCNSPYRTTTYQDVQCALGCKNGVCAQENNTNVCTQAGYGCTSAVRGCGSYTQKDLSCGAGSGVICCEKIPYCGDGICFTHPITGYGENLNNCPGDCGGNTSLPETLTIRGKLINQLTMEPVGNAKLYSGYYLPNDVITEADGSFKFELKTDFREKENTSAISNYWSGNFLRDCYGWSQPLLLKKENNQLFYTISKFDGGEVTNKVSGSDIDIVIYDYPEVDVSTISDIESSFFIMYKYKNPDGGMEYNGPGNGNFKKEHYLSGAIPLDYDVFIEFYKEDGTKYVSDTFHVPSDAMCKVVNLEYIKGVSKWNVGERIYFDDSEKIKVEPNSTTGPIEISYPEEQVNCNGCISDNKCYPFGYRKAGEYCKDDFNFTKQAVADNVCDNNFECSSNVCVDGTCISSGLIQKIISWFRKIFRY